MGTAELRSAFNDVGGPAGFTCARAELGYERHEGVEWQKLTFRGTNAAGQPFVTQSDRLRVDTDLLKNARDVATALVTASEGPKP